MALNFELLANLLIGKSLNRREAYRVFLPIFKSQYTPAQAKALLLLLAYRGEGAEEVEGCLRALRRLEPPFDEPVSGLMDTCGTGGDRSHSLNVSTLTAFVAAGAGCKVVKHGNRALSSQCGSSDLMEAFGVVLDAPYSRMVRSMRTYGIGYLHAPLYHPVFARVQPLRRSLKVRTIFNLLGPLVNPVKVKRQLIGVSRRQYLSLFAKVLSRMKVRRAMVCYSQDGLDEISTGRPTDVAVIEGGKIRHLKIDPRRLGFAKAKLRDYVGGTVKRNLDLSRRLLKGELKGPMRDIVILNSAAALYVAGKAKNIPDGIKLARASIDSGQAYRSVQGLVKLSRLRT